ncbi:hypothetical protein [Erythrobacter ani]|uniref:Uncharacterized protein n=1 Tax=Erythrobacter ani TaxID=2827235 RepID=A0ABS6SLJ9_9SPHN|nr:hypothetical protein [Erythrobacter ani]MBV7265900.1 hypothetical protein [Erythrobacter ani]
MIEEACLQMHFPHEPEDGWQYVARELRIIHFQLPELKAEGSLSRAQMAKKWDRFADQLWSISKEMGEIAWQEDFTMAALEIGSGREGSAAYEYVNLPNRVGELVGPARKLAAWLKLSGILQSRKIRPASERERRLVLACKLQPIFVDQFGMVATLKGGSACRPIEEESPWARFYQAAASLLLREKVTADRQSVLLEARRPPIE